MADFGEIVAEQASLMNAKALPVQVGNDIQNAETDGQAIYVNPQFMAQVESTAGEDGVRFVLAHELGHSHNGMELGGHEGEFAADNFASRAVALAGGTVESISGVFGLLGGGESATHPASSKRSVEATKEFERSRDEYVGRELADDSLAKSDLDSRPRERDLAI